MLATRSQFPARIIRPFGRLARCLILPCIAAWTVLPAQAQSTDSGWVTTRTHAFIPHTLTNQAVPMVRSSASLPKTMLIHVVITLKLRDKSGLESQIDQINRPGSPSYRQYLTPEQIQATYAPTSEQVQAVVKYLQQSGFENIKPSRNNLLIHADANPAAVETAFRTALVQIQQRDGKVIYGNAQDVQVPAALSDIIESVQGLQNAVVAHTNYTIQRTKSLSSRGQHTLNDGSTAPILSGHNPVEFSSIYDAGSTPTASATAVGVISEGDLTQTLSDLLTFTSNNALGPVATQVVHTGPEGSDYSDTAGTVEWNLDSQSIVGAAGGAVNQLVFYDAPSMSLGDITDAYNRAVTDNLVKVVNVSLGVCETDAQSTGSQAADDAIFKIAMAQGQVFSVAAGDHGVYECQGGLPTDLSSYSVSEPATSPYVIAVGGTTLYTNNQAYDHETVWNEGVDQSGVLWATGGGISQFEPAPTWQTDIGGHPTQRTVPDIAFDAAQASGAIIVYQGETIGTLPDAGPNDPNQIGGTSLAAPIFSGIWARIQSASNNSLAFPAASIYSNVPNQPTLVHNILSGNNGITENGATYGYSAAPGLSLVAGWGSFDITQLDYVFNPSNPVNNPVAGGGSGDPANPSSQSPDLFSLLGALLSNIFKSLLGSGWA